MRPLRFGKYTFSPKVFPTLAVIILVPFLISLGLWQLNRADEKKLIDDAIKQSQRKPPLPLNAFINSGQTNRLSSEEYRTAILTGYYDTKHQYLLDNRTYQGRAGYHVLTPFTLTGSDKVVLINRGWIGYQGTRENIKDIRAPKGKLKITGVIKQQGKSIVLDSHQTPLLANTYPQLIQSIDLIRLGNELHTTLLPIIIALNKEDTTGFTRDWKPYYGSIDRHNAYALQWFTMAAILLFLYIKLNTRKTKVLH